MNRVAALFFAVLIAIANEAAAQQKVESQGISAKVRLEEVISGHLPELNGKFLIRATEVTFEPGAHLGAHHHAGPGIRYVVSGELTFVQAGKATVYKTGDSFYESGNVVHTGQNLTKSPVRVMFFEILPTQWTGPSTIPPKL